MTKELSQKARKIVLKMQQNELTESVIYEKIAKFAKGEENKNTLRRLAQEEFADSRERMEKLWARRTMASYTDASPWGWYLPKTSPTQVADFLKGLSEVRPLSYMV